MAKMKILRGQNLALDPLKLQQQRHQQDLEEFANQRIRAAARRPEDVPRMEMRMQMTRPWED